MVRDGNLRFLNGNGCSLLPADKDLKTSWGALITAKTPNKSVNKK